MRFLNPTAHGVIDYVAIAGLAVAPMLFGFAGVAATICYAVAVCYLGMCLLTAYPLSLAKVIPFPVHGGVELVLSLCLMGMPWIAQFSSEIHARNFFLVSGIALLAVWVVTNYRAAEAPSGLRTPTPSAV